MLCRDITQWFQKGYPMQERQICRELLLVDLKKLLPNGGRQQARVERIQHGTRAFQGAQSSGSSRVVGLYTFARFRPPVCVCLLVRSARDATFATPRTNDRRRRVLAVLPAMFARSARSSYAIVDALDFGTPTASAGDAGAHPSLRLGGRRPSRGALRASRRNGRGVVSPKTGRRVNGVQQRIGKPRVIVVQDGQGKASRKLRQAGCVSVSVSVSGGGIRSRSDGWRD